MAGLLIAAPTASARQGCVSANATTAHATKRAIVRATLCALNRTRHHHGLHRLRLNKRLSRAARRHARDMARRNYFSHDTLGGGSLPRPHPPHRLPARRTQLDRRREPRLGQQGLTRGRR